MAPPDALFRQTSSLKRAALTINNVDADKLPLLLNRIIQKLHVQDERAFSKEEETKLEASLDVSFEELQSILKSSEHIFRQAAYHLSKPNQLKKELEAVGINEDRLSIFVDAWKENAREIVSRLKQNELVPQQLDGVAWQLNFPVSQSVDQLNALFELRVKNQGKEALERIKMEFTHDELFSFYKQLETVQSQLDSLS